MMGWIKTLVFLESLDVVVFLNRTLSNLAKFDCCKKKFVDPVYLEAPELKLPLWKEKRKVYFMKK